MRQVPAGSGGSSWYPASHSSEAETARLDAQGQASDLWPPIHIPRDRDALNLSRMRSPITSRSNWAKDNRILSVSRPMLVVVLNDCVTLTNVTLLRSNT